MSMHLQHRELGEGVLVGCSRGSLAWHSDTIDLEGVAGGGSKNFVGAITIRDWPGDQRGEEEWARRGKEGRGEGHPNARLLILCGDFRLETDSK
jgi:hypothetical protein